MHTDRGYERFGDSRLFESQPDQCYDTPPLCHTGHLTGQAFFSLSSRAFVLCLTQTVLIMSA